MLLIPLLALSLFFSNALSTPLPHASGSTNENAVDGSGAANGSGVYGVLTSGTDITDAADANQPSDTAMGVAGGNDQDTPGGLLKKPIKKTTVKSFRKHTPGDLPKKHEKSIEKQNIKKPIKKTTVKSSRKGTPGGSLKKHENSIKKQNIKRPIKKTTIKGSEEQNQPGSTVMDVAGDDNESPGDLLHTGSLLSP